MRFDSTPLPARVDFAVCGDEVLAVAFGEIDFSTCHLLRPGIQRALQDRLNLVIDIAQVEFLDSASAGLLARAADRLRDHGRTLQVVSPRPTIERVFRLLEHDRLFQAPASAPLVPQPRMP